MSNDQNRVLLLVGAGASVPAGYPKTSEITDQVYSGEHVFRNNSQSYYINQDVVSTVPLQPGIEMICRASEVIMPKRKGNYESLYDAIYKIRREYHSKYTPFKSAIIHYLRDLRQIIRSCRTDNPFLPQEDELLSNMLDYIKDITLEMILRNRGNESNTSYLNIYHQLLESDDIEGLDIFTLNHDTLLEDNLKRYPIIDGFETSGNSGISKWKPSLFDNPSNKSIRLFKLHGSINWYWLHRCRTHSNKNGKVSGSDSSTFLARFSNIDDVNKYRKPKDESREEHFELSNDRPSILIGHYMKNFEYTSMPYLKMIECFSNYLQNNDSLIICGYGWRDLGINKLLDDWTRYWKKPTRILNINNDKNRQESAEIDLTIEFYIEDIISDIKNINKEELKKRILLLRYT